MEQPKAIIATPNRGFSFGMFTHPVGALLALLAATLGVYSPALGGQFLWDDSFLVRTNLLIRSPLFCIEAFRHTLFNGESNFYRPTQTLTFIGDYWAWGLDPFGYHLTNILIHAVNAFLLFLVLRRVVPALLPDRGITETPEAAGSRDQTAWIALAIAFVWAVHPVHSAAVAYISGRADSLAMTFCLAGWLLIERALSTGRPVTRTVCASLAFCSLLLGLCSKEIAGIWLAIFLVWLFALRREPVRLRVKFFVVAGGLAALGAYVWLRHLPPPPLPHPPLPPLPPKWLLMLRALGDYGRLMLFPKKLFMERQVFAAPGLANPADESSYFLLGVGGALLLIAFAAGAFAWRGRGQTLRRFGAGWFLLGFLPISNLFSLNASVAEHWLYLPSIGFLLFLTGVIVDLPLQWVSGTSKRRWIPATCVLLVAAALGTRTYFRTFDWSDEVTFFRQTIRDGGDVPRARSGLAVAYSREDDHRAENNASAVAELRKIVTEHPRVLDARINLATMLAREGQTEEARTLFQSAAADLRARGGDPREVKATIAALDIVDAANPAWGDQRAALLENALRDHPDSWELVQLSAQDSERAHLPAQALASVARFADAHWWHGPAWYAVGYFEAELGRPDDALAAWHEAERLDVHDAAADSASAALCMELGRIDDAVSFQKRAVNRQPDSFRQHLLLADLYQRRGDAGAAAQERTIADRLRALK